MYQQIVLAGGCFWCTEAVFRQVIGVVDVQCGYMGGCAETANYPAVCGGETQHAEVVCITFDETMIDLHALFDIFFATHDPTTLNRQGNDVGRQYRSAIFYLNDEQRLIAQQHIDTLKQLSIPVVTEIMPSMPFYRAEDEHQRYYEQHPLQAYCYWVILPKLNQLSQDFKHYLREN